jgi:hypothetical protein
MGMVLKQIISESENAASQRNDEESKGSSNEPQISQTSSMTTQSRHLFDKEWTHFCSTELSYYEDKWTRKLED